MMPSELSSRHATADRRADYARMLADSGDPTGAADLMEQALELAPAWIGGWFNLGLYQERAGNRAGAAAAFERVVALDPEDLFGAPLHLAALGATPTPDRPSSRYIERLFDDYAERFDRSLVGRLAYGVPANLAALLSGMQDLPQHFRLAVDLGCGTGLFGAEIRPRVGRLEGFDLSRKMLAKAAEKGPYDRLEVADLSLPASGSGLFGADLPAHRADLIVATDVMIYLGDLDNILDLAVRLAAPGAVFAFSVEDAGEESGFCLAQSLRYAHSAAYVEAVCGRFGFDIRGSEPTVIREDNGAPVSGMLFVAQLPR